jgi:hypothetical protein
VDQSFGTLLMLNLSLQFVPWCVPDDAVGSVILSFVLLAFCLHYSSLFHFLWLSTLFKCICCHTMHFLFRFPPIVFMIQSLCMYSYRNICRRTQMNVIGFKA